MTVCWRLPLIGLRMKVGLGKLTDEEIVLVFDHVAAPVDRVRYRCNH